MRLTGVDGADLDDVLDPAWVDGSSTTLTPDGIALDQATAEALNVGLGDSIAMTFTSNGVEQLTVQGIYRQGSLLLGGAMVDRETLVRQVPASADIAALVALKEDTPASIAAVEELAASYGVESVLRPSEFVDSRSQLLNGFQRVIQWMLLFTLLQALVGVVNTLLLSVGERRREFGLLRVTGASRRQLLRLVLIEGLAFAVVGTVLGLLVGIGGAVAAVRALAQYGISTVDLPAGVLVVTALAAMILGVAAAVVPARWAAAVPPLEAVADAGGDVAARRRRRDARRQDRRRDTASVPAPTSGATPPPYRPAASAPAPPPPLQPPALSPAPPPTPAALPALGPAQPAQPAQPVRPTPPVPPPATPFSPEPAGRRRRSAADGWLRSTTSTAAGADPAESDRAARVPLFGPGPMASSERTAERRAAASTPLDEPVRIRLGAALDRLDPATQLDARSVLSVFARSLEPDERIEHLAQGWTKGLLCLVARTDRDVVVVVDRFPEPLVERLRRDRATITVYGPPGTDRVSLAVVDGRRLLEVTGVRDRAEAAGLAGRTSGRDATPAYF
jgi:hypothetical protein